MEEKELNLSELLTGCEGEEFYSPLLGDVTIHCIEKDKLIIRGKVCITIESNGKWLKDGLVQLYPSRALYEKYPLDAKKAWSEWSESREKEKCEILVNAVVFNSKHEITEMKQYVFPFSDKTLSDIDSALNRLKE